MTGNARAKILGETLDNATDKFLENDKSPARRIGQIDNRGSHFYLALYWAQGLAAQTADAELAATFTAVAKTLADNEEKIVGELNGAQGQPQKIEGYYKSDDALTSKAMRPSATLNAALETIAVTA